MSKKNELATPVGQLLFQFPGNDPLTDEDVSDDEPIQTTTELIQQYKNQFNKRKLNSKTPSKATSITTEVATDDLLESDGISTQTDEIKSKSEIGVGTRETYTEKIVDVIKWIGPMNILLFIAYTVLLLIGFIVIKPWFLYDYPDAETKNQCVLQYCLGSNCYDMTGQEINDSIREGMKRLNWKKCLGYYFGILFVLIIIHFLIANVGILNIGTNSGRCKYRPIGC